MGIIGRRKGERREMYQLTKYRSFKIIGATRGSPDISNLSMDNVSPGEK